jgi:TolB-like protein/Flp pilus assembly protein TadD
MAALDHSDDVKRLGTAGGGLPAGIPAGAVRAELETVLRSPALIHSGRLCRFLTFVVDQALDGHADQLKEYVIGLAVFDKDESFDPRLDPIVRVEAGRLRAKLNHHYENDGRQDPIVIEFLRGSYAPTFRRSEPPSVPVRLTGTAADTAPEKKTIAVLPFADQSPNRDQEYFCDGMSMELINALTKVEGLRATAWSSTRHLKRQDYDIREIGRRLRVEAALEGSVRREGEQLRITAQLVDVGSGCYIWSETYDRQLKDVFAIQEEISRAIVSSLKVHLVQGGERQLVKRSTENPTAYRLYLKGRYCWNRRSQQGLWDGVKNFEKALEIDPAYGLAHAGVADSYSLLGNYGVLPSHMVRARAKEAAVKAVELDPTLAEAHTSLGHVAATYDWDWELAEREFELAIQLTEYYATAHHWYAITCLMPLRRLDEALLEIERAHELDATSASIARDTGVVLYCRREYDRAASQALRTLELDPSFYEGYWILGLACEQRAGLEEACAAFRQGASLSRAPRLIGALGHSYALMGKRKEALEIVQELAAMSRRRYVSPFDTALVYMGLAEKDTAFAWLDKALAQRCYEMVWLKVDPRWDVLRSDPRFTSILDAIGLEPATSPLETAAPETAAVGPLIAEPSA